MVRGRYDDGPDAPAPAPPRVLIVDDEPANVRLMEAYLKADGLRTVGVLSGAAALEAVQQGDVDLVLLDIRMPHMDGLEVCRQLRKNPAYRRIPVVFLTAEFHDSESELQGLEAGADEYLHKPIQRRALVARVKNLIRLADAERDRRLMTQLAQSEKLVALGQIAAGIAHEVNNPLAFILSNLDSFDGYVKDVKDVVAAYRESSEAGRQAERSLDFQTSLDDLEALLKETREGGHRVQGIVQELRSFSRSDEFGFWEPVDLADVAARAFRLTEREICLRARLVKDLKPARVERAQVGKLDQVVLNLIINAMQALPPRPKDENEISVVTGTEGNFAVLRVSDTGVGIPQEQLRRIFEPFFTTKPVGVGTGIGLAVCASIVDKLGGSMEVQSEVGRGATFEVRLPQQLPNER